MRDAAHARLSSAKVPPVCDADAKKHGLMWDMERSRWEKKPSEDGLEGLRPGRVPERPVVSPPGLALKPEKERRK